MKHGDVCILTNDVVRLSDFYKMLLNTDNKSNDNVQQTIIAKDTMLTIYNDGVRRVNGIQKVYLAFNVDDVDAEYERMVRNGVEIVEQPTVQPWGVNMCIHDPDQNVVYLRSFPKK